MSQPMADSLDAQSSDTHRTKPLGSRLASRTRGILILAVVVVLAYGCFFALRFSQPVIASEASYAIQESLPYLVLRVGASSAGTVEASESGVQADGTASCYAFSVPNGIEAVELALFGFSDHAVSARLFSGTTVEWEGVFDNTSSLSTPSTIELTAEPATGNGCATYTLSLDTAADAGRVFVGTPGSLSGLVSLSVKINDIEIGLLAAVALYGLTLFAFKRSERYMLYYAVYVLTLLLQAILFSQDFSGPLPSNVYIAIRTGTNVFSEMLAIGIGFRLMEIHLPGRLDHLLRIRTAFYCGLIVGIVALLFWSPLGNVLTVTYNTAFVLAAAYGCLQSRSDDMFIAAMLLLSALTCANGSLFKPLDFADSFVYCALFTTPPLFTLPFVLVVMIAVNRLFARKFAEAELLNVKLDGLVQERTASLREQERQRRQLMLNVFHDLRGPLFVVKESASVGIDQPELSQNRLKVILERATFMEKLVGDLFYLAKLEEGRMVFAEDAFDAAELARESLGAWQGLAGTGGVSIRLCAPDTATVIGDDLRLKEAIDNLVDNAVKHSQKGGTVDVTVNVDSRHLTDGNSETVCITVSDQGPGMTEEEQARAFEQYYCRDRGRFSKSTGIGLSIVRQIVCQMGGEVGVTSAPGKGSTFEIRLPHEE